MVSIRVDEEDRKAGMDAPMPECPVYERFGLLIRRGLAQDATARAAYLLALQDLLAATRCASDGDPALITVDRVEAEAERLEREYK